MPISKSGISSPVDSPKKSLDVPVKIYPGSKDIGKGASEARAEKNIKGPCSGPGIDGK